MTAGARFEWDDTKAATNYRKHGVTFELACTVFDDPDGIYDLDERENYAEERFNLLGLSSVGVILNVTFTERGIRFRIISARQALKNEVKSYFQRG